MRIVGSTRVSTSDQDVAAQRHAIEAAAAARGWEIIAIHEDRGASGGSMDGRPGLAACIESIETGEADALVVARLDRLSRSLLDFASLMERARRGGWAIVCLDLGVDTSTPSGEMLASVLASFAVFERRLIGQRTKDALAVKKSAGVRLGRRPVPDEVRARIVSMRGTGKTLRAICDALNEEGVATAQGAMRWWPETVRGIAMAAERSGDAGQRASARARDGQTGEARTRRYEDAVATGGRR